MKNIPRFSSKLTLLFLLATIFAIVVCGEETSSSSNKNEEEPVDSFNAKDHTDWGTYYDPKNIFCGKYDCYRILGFDYENYGTEKPTTRTITKRYRALSRAWHPDKSTHKDAKERFVKIARAYEVLTDVQQRKEYDMMRYNQEAYFQKYGSDVMFKYAPKTDTVFVIVLLLAIVNWFSWAAQKQKWQQVANRLIQASIEDWSPSQGGTPESKSLREQALEILKVKQQDQEKNGTSAPSNNKSKKTSGSSAKLSAKEKKAKEQEQLKPIITDLVNEMHDFGAGFHKPTWKDLFIVKMSYWPYYIASGATWQAQYYLRRWQGMELNEEERRVLTERAVGPVVWELTSEEGKSDLIKRELWIMENLVAWNEEQEIKNMSRADQRMYNKMKKKSTAAPSKED